MKELEICDNEWSAICRIYGVPYELKTKKMLKDGVTRIKVYHNFMIPEDLLEKELKKVQDDNRAEIMKVK
jgi:hypothetical protein